MNKLLKASVLAVSFALAACANDPRVVVKVDLPQHEAPSAPQALDRWWESFGDATLSKLVNEALQHNADILVAAERIRQSQGALDEARAALVPSINAELDPSRSHTSAVSQQPGRPPVGNRFKGGISASWEVDLWGRLSSAREAARAKLLAADYAQQGMRSSIAAQTARSYFILLGLDSSEALYTQTLATRSEALNLQYKRFKAGSASEYELRLSEAEQAQIAAALPSLRASRERAEAALGVLLGRSPKDIIEGDIARGPGLGELVKAPEIPAGLHAELLTRRPDVRQAQAQLQATEFNVDAARAAYFPSLSLTGFFGGESLELGKMFDSANRSWSLAGAITQPLIGLAAIGARVDTARAARNEAVLNYERAARNAYGDAKSALATHRASRETLLAAQTRVEAQNRAKALIDLRYKQGVSSMLDVVDAERNRLAAESDRVNALRDRLTALVDVYQALGGGWSEAATN